MIINGIYVIPLVFEGLPVSAMTQTVVSKVEEPPVLKFWIL